MAKITVEFAVYGALAHGDENIAEAKDVKSILENLINTKDGIVKIDNKNMGGDPSKGYTKHFGAQIIRNGDTFYFACQEGQTIDFYHNGTPRQ